MESNGQQADLFPELYGDRTVEFLPRPAQLETDAELVDVDEQDKVKLSHDGQDSDDPQSMAPVEKQRERANSREQADSINSAHASSQSNEGHESMITKNTAPCTAQPRHLDMEVKDSQTNSPQEILEGHAVHHPDVKILDTNDPSLAPPINSRRTTKAQKACAKSQILTASKDAAKPRGRLKQLGNRIFGYVFSGKTELSSRRLSGQGRQLTFTKRRFQGMKAMVRRAAEKFRNSG